MDMAPPATPIVTDLSRVPSRALAPAAPRPPLQERHSNGSPSQALLGAAEGEKGPITTFAAATQAPKRGPKPQPRVLNSEDLEEFKEAVIGSPLGKIELCKGLKARYASASITLLTQARADLFLLTDFQK